MSTTREMLKSKTTWTGITGVIGAAGGFFTGALDSAQAIQLAITSLLGVFLRQGIAKKE